VNAADIVAALRGDPRKFPKKALKAALENPGEAVPALLQILRDTLRDARRGDLPTDGAALYAMFLLAQLRERAAYPLVVDLFSLRGDLGVELIGDIYDHDLHRILASVSHGDTVPIERMVSNRKVHELIRACAVEALRTMVLAGLAERDRVVAFYRRLFDGALERNASDVWNELVESSAELHPAEVSEGIRRAVADGVLEAGDETVKQAEAALRLEPAAVLARSRARFLGLIDHAVEELSDWHDSDEFEIFFEQEAADEDSEDAELDEDAEGEPVETFRHTAPPPGRNDPCPCGSGKKYKKCCGS
jgi:hypothetical protein